MACCLVSACSHYGIALAKKKKFGVGYWSHYQVAFSQYRFGGRGLTSDQCLIKPVKEGRLGWTSRVDGWLSLVRPHPFSARRGVVAVIHLVYLCVILWWLMMDAGVTFDVRRLSVGDFTWVAREKSFPKPGGLATRLH